MKNLMRSIHHSKRTVKVICATFIYSYSQITIAETASCTFVFRHAKNYSSANLVILQSIQKMLTNSNLKESLITEQTHQMEQNLNTQQIILNNEIKYLDKILSIFFRETINNHSTNNDRLFAEKEYHSAFQLQSANFRELVKIEEQTKSIKLLKTTYKVNQIKHNLKGETSPILAEIQKTQDSQIKIKLLSEFLSKNNQLSLLDYQLLLEKILPDVDFNSQQANLMLINALNKKFQVEWKNWDNIGQLGLAYYLLFKVNKLNTSENNQDINLEPIYKNLLKNLNNLTIKAQGFIAIKRNTEAENNDNLFKAQLKTLIADTLHKHLNDLAVRTVNQYEQAK